MDFKNKYLKYKEKYLLIKNQQGGMNNENVIKQGGMNNEGVINEGGMINEDTNHQISHIITQFYQDIEKLTDDINHLRSAISTYYMSIDNDDEDKLIKKKYLINKIYEKIRNILSNYTTIIILCDNQFFTNNIQYINEIKNKIILIKNELLEKQQFFLKHNSHFFYDSLLITQSQQPLQSKLSSSSTILSSLPSSSPSSSILSSSSSSSSSSLLRTQRLQERLSQRHTRSQSLSSITPLKTSSITPPITPSSIPPPITSSTLPPPTVTLPPPTSLIPNKQLITPSTISTSTTQISFISPLKIIEMEISLINKTLIIINDLLEKVKLSILKNQAKTLNIQKTENDIIELLREITNINSEIAKYRDTQAITGSNVTIIVSKIYELVKINIERRMTIIEKYNSLIYYNIITDKKKLSQNSQTYQMLQLPNYEIEIYNWHSEIQTQQTKIDSIIDNIKYRLSFIKTAINNHKKDIIKQNKTGEIRQIDKDNYDINIITQNIIIKFLNDIESLKSTQVILDTDTQIYIEQIQEICEREEKYNNFQRWDTLIDTIL
jgi:hypothetical protein